MMETGREAPRLPSPRLGRACAPTAPPRGSSALPAQRSQPRGAAGRGVERVKAVPYRRPRPRVPARPRLTFTEPHRARAPPPGPAGAAIGPTAARWGSARSRRGLGPDPARRPSGLAAGARPARAGRAVAIRCRRCWRRSAGGLEGGPRAAPQPRPESAGPELRRPRALGPRAETGSVRRPRCPLRAVLAGLCPEPSPESRAALERHSVPCRGMRVGTRLPLGAGIATGTALCQQRCCG